ncbi:MAG: FHA domain-containing protein, partial [Victivallaceae bacterium]
MSFLLKITSEKNHGEEFLLNVGENLVGRSRSANIRVFNEDVSGKHFVVEILQNSVILHNL